MYIYRIEIEGYRNFHHFTMDFNDGLNVIVGPNNSGKTGLLLAINLLNNPSEIEVEDFNKNDLQSQFASFYKQTPPSIVIKYYIKHDICEDNTDDECIVKLLSFIGMEEIMASKASADDSTQYTISACVEAKYTLNPKKIEEYRQAVSSAKSFDEFYSSFSLFQKYYGWTYSNGITETIIDPKEATNIFKIDFIEAERKSESVYNETKHEIEKYLKNDPSSAEKIQNLQKELSNNMKEAIKPVLDRISNLIEHEDNNIGLYKGNVAISQDMRPSATIAGAYVIEVKDTKEGYTLPLSHNGLGYNNLINMYMMVKLVEIQKGKDFHILCLEEPEAHLHPAMQYKLFKFLKKLDDDDKLNQQIFVTTHSPNITAVAGLDNTYMMSYDRNKKIPDCTQQSLKCQFSQNLDAQRHMMKFLDVTRSDMLFADKVIFVEGIAEKLLLPKFLEKCKYAYEDEHISIVEVGGKNFSYFVRAFANNPVNKKVLCITDCDFDWSFSNGAKTVEDYEATVPPHVEKLKNEFSNAENLKIVFQKNYGSTFEDDLYMCNIANIKVAKKLLKIAMPKSLHTYIDTNGIDFNKWKKNINSIPQKSNEKVSKIINDIFNAILFHPENTIYYEKLFFAKLFYDYVENEKGNIALNILVDEELMKELEVPLYIKEGITWLSI